METNAEERPDGLHFFRTWLSRPDRIGSVTPSGEPLCRLMTREISPQGGPILELGPGTGVFTSALLSRGVAESDLTLIEFEANFARMLQSRYPEARVLQMDASQIGRHELFPHSSVNAVISGLPLLLMSTRQVMGILRGAFQYLSPEGSIYQFTYGPRCPVLRPILDRLDLRATCIGRVVRNVPPASVYRISRR